MVRNEKKVQERINKIIDNYISKKYKKEKGKKNIIISYNPLTSHLYFRTSYQYIKTFINYYKENAEFLNQLEIDQMEDQNDNSDIGEIQNGNSASNIAFDLSKNKNLINK